MVDDFDLGWEHGYEDAYEPGASKEALEEQAREGFDTAVEGSDLERYLDGWEQGWKAAREELEGVER